MLPARLLDNHIVGGESIAANLLDLPGPCKVYMFRCAEFKQAAKEICSTKKVNDALCVLATWLLNNHNVACQSSINAMSHSQAYIAIGFSRATSAA